MSEKKATLDWVAFFFVNIQECFILRITTIPLPEYLLINILGAYKLADENLDLYNL